MHCIVIAGKKLLYTLQQQCPDKWEVEECCQCQEVATNKLEEGNNGNNKAQQRRCHYTGKFTNNKLVFKE